MIESTRRLRFLFKSGETISVSGKRSWQNFDGDIAAKFRIAGAPNFTHATFANLRDDGVLSDDRVGGNVYAQVLCEFPTDYADYGDYEMLFFNVSVIRLRSL